MKLPITVSEELYAELSNDHGGFCRACGEEAYGVEPDAEHYACEVCGAREVFGAEQLLIMGQLVFDDEADA